MKFRLALGASFAAVAVATNIPMREHDPRTVKSCIEWYNNYEEDSCENIRDFFNITPEEFSSWNPSIDLDCQPWWPVSYCILTKEKWDWYKATHPTATTTSSSTSTPTSTSTLQPSPTAWDNRGCYAEGSTVPVMKQRISPEGGGRNGSLG